MFFGTQCILLTPYIFRPLGMVVPGGLMFYCCLFFFFRHLISELILAKIRLGTRRLTLKLLYALRRLSWSISSHFDEIHYSCNMHCSLKLQKITKTPNFEKSFKVVDFDLNQTGVWDFL